MGFAYSKVSVTIPVEIDVERLTVRYAYPVPGEETVIVTETFDSLHYLARCFPELMPDLLADQIQRNLARRHKSRDSYGSHLPPAKVAALQAAGRSVPLQFQTVLENIFKETSRYLQSLESSVRGGKSVNEAVDFSRWLQFSGVLSLLEICKDLNPEFATLRRRATDLVQTCAEHLRGGKVPAQYCQGDIDRIESKLDALFALAFAKPAPQVAQNVLDVEVQ